MINFLRRSFFENRFNNDVVISKDDPHQENTLKLFNFYDENADGNISRTEFRNFLHSLDATLKDHEISSMFKSYDTDASDFLDFPEFLDFVKFKFVKDAISHTCGDALDKMFDQKELEVLIQYIKLEPIFRGETLNILRKNKEENLLLVMESYCKEDLDLGEKLSILQIRTESHRVKKNGIAIKLNVKRIIQLVKKHPLIALKLNQSLNNQLTAILASYVRTNQPVFELQY